MRRLMIGDAVPQFSWEEVECCCEQPQGQMESGSWQASDLCESGPEELVESQVLKPFHSVVSHTEEDLSVPPGPCSEDRSLYQLQCHIGSGLDDIVQQPACRDPSDMNSLGLPLKLQNLSLSSSSPLQFNCAENATASRRSYKPVCTQPAYIQLPALFRCQQEVVELILCSLSPASLSLLMRSCKAGRCAVDSFAVWRHLLSRDYPQDEAARDPKEAYRRAAASAAVYVVGGCSPALAAVGDVHRFALGARHLAWAPPLAAPRVFAAVARLGARLYVLGGCTSLSSCLRRCQTVLLS